jgi:hypothetical protein
MQSSSLSTTDHVTTNDSPSSERFRPATEDGSLTFTLPTLSKREETFLKQQIRIALDPDCMKSDKISGPNFSFFLSENSENLCDSQRRVRSVLQFVPFVYIRQLWKPKLSWNNYKSGRSVLC